MLLNISANHRLWCGSVLYWILVVLPASGMCERLTASIKVHSDEVLSPVNRLVFGNNVIGNKTKYQVELFNKTGGGLWDVGRNEPNREAVKFIKEAGFKLLRWPGGGWKDRLELEKLVGPVDRRKFHAFGLPEFMRLCEAVDAVPLITLPPDKKLIDSSINLIVYLNGDPSKIAEKDKIKWIKQREMDGRSQPWNVEYFEFGNETYLSEMPVDEYINNFMLLKQALKDIAPNAKLGAVLEDSDNVDSGWNFDVVKSLASNADFFSIHPYLPKVTEREISLFGLDAIARSTMASNADLQFRLNEYKRLFEKAGVPEFVKLAVTEFNGHFVQNDPYPLRFSLLNSVHNADFIRLFLHPENRILLAAYWHLADSYWGMLQLNKGGEQQFTPQADYFLFKLMNNYVLDNLVKIDIDSPVYAFEGAGVISARLGRSGGARWEHYQHPVDQVWNIRMFSGANESQSDGVLKINFQGGKDINYYHAYRILEAKGNTLYRVSIMARAVNLKGKIGIAVEDARGWKKTLYQPSNIQLTGTTPWKRLTVVFKSLPDTKAMRISIRHVKGSGRLSGIAEFKNLTIEERPNLAPKIQSITGFSTVSNDKDKLGVILINKNLESDIYVRLSVPDGYKLVRAETMTARSYYDSNIHSARAVKITELDVPFEDGSWRAVLLPVTVSGLLFRKTSMY